MNIAEMYPSTYLRSLDIPKRGLTLVVNRLLNEELRDGESKWVLYFKGEKRGLVLNKTNATALASTYGDDTDTWIGKPVNLQVHKVSFQGRLVDGIRAMPVEFDDDVPV